MKKICILIIAGLFTLTANQASAYDVIKVKNKKILLSFSPDESVQVKDSFYVINNSGKKKAIVLILKVKGQKAIAKILKGKAQPGWSLRLRRKAPLKHSFKKSAVAQNRVAPVNYSKKKQTIFNHLSFLWGTSFNSFTTGNLIHKDSSLFNFETSTTFFLPRNPMFGLRILSGSENFAVKATCATESGTKNCSTDIVYLSGGALAVVQIPITNIFSAWGGLGFKLLMPIAKTVTELSSEYLYIKEDSIKLTSALVLSGGVKFRLNPTFAIPLNFNYTLFPSSDSVKDQSSISIQTGLVYHF